MRLLCGGIVTTGDISSLGNAGQQVKERIDTGLRHPLIPSPDAPLRSIRIADILQSCGK